MPRSYNLRPRKTWPWKFEHQSSRVVSGCNRLWYCSSRLGKCSNRHHRQSDLVEIPYQYSLYFVKYVLLCQEHANDYAECLAKGEGYYIPV